MNATDDKKNVQLVQVYVRQRPFTQNEIELKRPSVVSNTSSREIAIKCGATEKKYTFDRVFGVYSTQSEVYEVVVHPMIELIMSGYSCTVFAYGQTGTGKTYTMIGNNISPNVDFLNEPSVGMVPRATAHLFSELNKLNQTYSVRVSFVEIYNEEVRDLLVSDSVALRVYEDPDNKGATCVRGVTEIAVSNSFEVYDLLNMGVSERQTAATNLNRHSSRSHTIFTMIVTVRETTNAGEEIMKTGKLHLIDLAGSENIGRSGATEMRAREAGTINKSLLTLGKVIKALAQKMQHIPYRESKLTRILQDSLGGKSKTSMIATFSPCVDAFDETVSTLDYAHVARSVANCPTVNINKKQTNVLKHSQDEVENLRQELKAARTGEGFYMNNASYEKMTNDIKTKTARVLHLMQEISRVEQHISAKQQSYDELNRDFEHTSQKLHSIEQELEKKNTQAIQNEKAIEEIDGKITHLTEITDLLSNVCEVSANHGDIYHRKYDRQCNSTVHNASVATNMFTTIVSCLGNLKDNTKNFVKSQNVFVDFGVAKVDAIKKNHNINQKQLQEVLSEMTTTASCNLTVDSIFRDKTYSQDKLLSQFDSFFNDSSQFQQQKAKEMIVSVENVRDFITDKVAFTEEHTAKCSAVIDQAFDEDNEQFIPTDTYLQSVCDNLQKRSGCIQEQSSRVRTIKDFYANYLKVAEAKCREVENELEYVQTEQSMTDDFLCRTKEDTPQPLLKVEDGVVTFNQCLEPLKEFISLVQNTADSLVESTAICESEVKSCERKTNEYFLQFMNVFEDDVNSYNEDLKDLMFKWADQLDSIQESLHQTTQQQCTHLESCIGDIADGLVTYNKGIEDLVQNSKEKIKNAEKDIVLKIHEGDTPAKVIYTYPKVIEKGISQDLSKVMNSSP